MRSKARIRILMWGHTELPQSCCGLPIAHFHFFHRKSSRTLLCIALKAHEVRAGRTQKMSTDTAGEDRGRGKREGGGGVSWGRDGKLFLWDTHTNTHTHTPGNTQETQDVARGGCAPVALCQVCQVCLDAPITIDHS